MLISIIMYLQKFVPNCMSALFNAFMPIVIMLFGFALLFNIVGIKYNGNITTSIVDNVFKTIGYICLKLAKGFWWICKSIYQLAPKVFKKVKRFLIQKGATDCLSNFIAVLVTIVLLVIII